eukprot:3556532-Lingulodinium_polyedra.AAC.1
MYEALQRPASSFSVASRPSRNLLKHSIFMACIALGTAWQLPAVLTPIAQPSAQPFAAMHMVNGAERQGVVTSATPADPI